jgi:malate dehydrogenase
MERKDLLAENGASFRDQGKGINSNAASDVRIVVVGNPCNTNCLIAMRHAPDIPTGRWAALTRLDENRAKAQLAIESGHPVSAVTRMTIWGNHSATQYPDFENAFIGGVPAVTTIGDREWLETKFVETIQKRGAAILAARGKSSAASAANAVLDHVRSAVRETKGDDWFSAAILSDGNPYGIPDGIVFSFPVKSDGAGHYRIVEGIDLSSYARQKLEITTDELLGERKDVIELMP